MGSFATPYLFHLFLRCHSAPGEEFSDRWHLEDLGMVMAMVPTLQKADDVRCHEKPGISVDLFNIKK